MGWVTAHLRPKLGVGARISFGLVWTTSAAEIMASSSCIRALFVATLRNDLTRGRGWNKFGTIGACGTMDPPDLPSVAVC